MFHLQGLELLHWDYCRRVQLPLDASIVTIAGPNGSGKTTLLDALRTLLGLDCSAGRSYKTYARHAGAQSCWLRAVVDNRPRGRQSSTRPFATSLLYADRVTLACRIDRAGGDWQRRYLMVDGDMPIEALIERPEKEVPLIGVEAWRKRLAAAGLTPAIARVLSLEQGQTDRLCEFSPRELLRLVFDVFGDQEVLDRYDQARSHQQQLAREVDQAERELAHGHAQLEALRLRVTNWQQYQLKLREREHLATEVVPVLEWMEERGALAQGLRDWHRQRLQAAAESLRRADQRRALLGLHERAEAARAELAAARVEQAAARAQFENARDLERPVEALTERAAELRALAAVEADGAQLQQRLAGLQQALRTHEERYRMLEAQRRAVQAELAALEGQRLPPAPSEVLAFRQALRRKGIAHRALAEVVELRDERWRGAVEGVLRPYRWLLMLERPEGEGAAMHAAEGAAMQLAEAARYRHYVVAHNEPAPQPSDDSLLAAVRFDAPVPPWLARQLAGIRCVETVDEGRRHAGEWITREAYWRDSRGGRSVWLDPAQHQFGAAAILARREHLAGRGAQLDVELTRLLGEQQTLQRQHDDAQRSLAGHQAADELAARAQEFQRAGMQLATLQAARRSASDRMTRADQRQEAAVRADGQAAFDYDSAQQRLAHSEQEAERVARDATPRRAALAARSAASRERGERLPARWRSPVAQAELRRHYTNAQQARLRAEAVEQDLAGGQWETDPSVEERHRLMAASVLERDAALADRRASNESARVAAHNARERYIEVLRATVRRYRKNIQELGQLAGVEVSAELPHLDNDDAVLAQAALAVKFSFDGKGAVGLNDGEASGGQQVIKSLILLVGLMKDDETPGGFVFTCATSSWSATSCARPARNTC